MKGRKVILHPDYDVAGYQALRGKTDDKKPGLIKLLEAVGVDKIHWCFPEKDSPEGWDIADRVWHQGELVDWISKQKRYKMQKHPLEKEGKKPKREPNYEKPPGFEHNELIDKIAPPDSEQVSLMDLEDAPFKVLGYSKDIRYYMPHLTQQIVELTPAGHTKAQLMNLAPLIYWMHKFGDLNKTSRINWDWAADRLLKMSAQAGLFDKRTAVRGRGAWLDDGRSVLHLGGKVFVDGDEFYPQQVDSSFIYEKNHNIGFQINDAASDKQARDLVDTLLRFSWENSLSACLLAGYCVVAPVCGILDWRPHVWVTGPSGSGKTTVLELIVKVMLGKFSIETVGSGTEAGIRQDVGQDAAACYC